MDLLSDDDQWEAFKAWMKENGLALIGGVAVAVVIVVGWRWWQQHKETRALEANARYVQILETFDKGDIDGGVKLIDSMQSDYGSSAYAAPAELAAARMYVQRNELDKAAARLKSVMDNAPDELLRPIARLRLARVQLAQDKPDDAIATLAGLPDPGAFKAVYAEVRGDALFAKGDKPGALREYEQAAAARLTGGNSISGDVEGADLLDLKLHDLRAAATTGPEG